MEEEKAKCEKCGDTNVHYRKGCLTCGYNGEAQEETLINIHNEMKAINIKFDKMITLLKRLVDKME